GSDDENRISPAMPGSATARRLGGWWPVISDGFGQRWTAAPSTPLPGPLNMPSSFCSSTSLNAPPSIPSLSFPLPLRSSGLYLV
ncbi:Oral-facial-digital syndrome 1 protein, partial [Dissostichus eleginoides]